MRNEKNYFVNGDQDRWYPVDKHLKDDWLDSLNSLTWFDLKSICEGHAGKGVANIMLRVKKELYDVASRHIFSIAALLNIPDTKVEITTDNYHGSENKYITVHIEFCTRVNELSTFNEFTKHRAWPHCREWFPVVVDRIVNADKQLQLECQ